MKTEGRIVQLEAEVSELKGEPVRTLAKIHERKRQQKKESQNQS